MILTMEFVKDFQDLESNYLKNNNFNIIYINCSMNYSPDTTFQINAYGIRNNYEGVYIKLSIKEDGYTPFEAMHIKEKFKEDYNLFQIPFRFRDLFVNKDSILNVSVNPNDFKIITLSLKEFNDLTFSIENEETINALKNFPKISKELKLLLELEDLHG